MQRTDEGRRGRRALKSLLAAPELVAHRRPGPRLLIYHQVGTSIGREMEISSSMFADQIAYLLSEGSIVSLDEALERFGTDGADRLFVITFDDGYADVYDNAFPVLAALRIPFSLYLTTAPIEEQTNGTFKRSGAVPLSWDRVAEMHATGLVTIGNHTHTHPDLRHMAPADVVNELDTSNALIEERLGVRPKHFAYPKGWWSALAEPIVKKRFATAVLGEGPPNTGGTDPLRIHRVAVQKSDGMRFFRRKLSTGLVLEDRLRRILRSYHGPPRTSTIERQP